MDTAKIQSFTDLIVWQKGHELVLEVYRMTKKFPKEELFALVSQIRRAVVSVTSNIAEGFGRTSKKEKLHFYSFAYGSLLEVRNQLFVAKDLNYIAENEFIQVSDCAIEISKMLQGLMKKINLSPSY